MQKKIWKKLVNVNIKKVQFIEKLGYNLKQKIKIHTTDLTVIVRMML